MNPAEAGGIRPMQPEDAPAVAWIDRLSNPLPWSLNAYRREPARPHSRAWVVERTLTAPLAYGNQASSPELPPFVRAAGACAPVGFIVTWHIVDEVHIANLAVHPAFRRQGLGRALLRHALEAARRSGMTSALLEVRAGNAAALALYRAFGFEVVGRRKGYYQDNREDALLMTLSPLRETED